MLLRRMIGDTEVFVSEERAAQLDAAVEGLISRIANFPENGYSGSGWWKENLLRELREKFLSS